MPVQYMYLWEYVVAPGKADDFQRAYGPEGEWVRLFTQAPGYVRTELHRDNAEPNRFVTIDYWESETAWTEFRTRFCVQFEALDAQCAALTLREAEIGRFEPVGASHMAGSGRHDQAELYRDDDRRVLESGVARLLIEEPQTTPDGRTITPLTSKVPLRDAKGAISGVLGTYMDITDRKLVEEALELGRARLKRALEDVKTLRGIVPICSKCKRVRDDEGYWNQVEKYVSDHSEAQFSHGICPTCAKELYPELVQD